MFKIAKSSAKLNGDQIDIEIYVSPASNGSFTYDALYIGRWDDETKEPLVMGEVDTELNLEKFAFSYRQRKMVRKSSLYQETEEHRSSVPVNCTETADTGKH